MCQKEDILSKVFFYFCDISPPTRSTRDRVEKRFQPPLTRGTLRDIGGSPMPPAITLRVMA